MRSLPPEEGGYAADGGCGLPRHPAGGEGAGVRKARVGAADLWERLGRDGDTVTDSQTVKCALRMGIQ